MPANAYPDTNLKKYQIKDLIEYGFADCGLLREAQTPQLVNSAKQALHYLLQDISNRGELLFNWRSVYLSPRANTRQYLLPEGTIDVRELNWVNTQIPQVMQALPIDNPTAPNAFDKTLMGNPAIASAQENWLGADLGSDFIPTFVGVNAYQAQTYQLVLENSSDGVTWSNPNTLSSQSLNDGEWMYWVLDGQISSRYWRIRSVQTVLSVRQIVFGTSISVIPIVRLNKDDYWNLSNRNINYGTRSLQYWFDRQADSPIINFWPIPQDDFQVFDALLEQEMPDIGSLGDSISIPNRWINAIQATLSAKLALQLPNVQGDRIQLLHQLADVAMKSARDEERDKSPLNLRPNNSYYVYTGR